MFITEHAFTDDDDNAQLTTIDVLSEVLTIRDPSVVGQHFAKRRPDLLSVLVEAATQLKSRMTVTALVLEPTRHGELALVVRVPASEQSWNAVEAFRDEWWIERVIGDDAMTLDTEFM